MTNELAEAAYFLSRAYDELQSARGCIDRGFPQHDRNVRWDEMTSLMNQVQKMLVVVRAERERKEHPK